MNGFFGEHIRSLRKRKGLSQRDLARLVGVSQAQISLHEKGKDLPRPAVRIRYALALGVTLEDFEDLILRSRMKEFLRASYTLSEAAKHSIEEYIDFAWERDRQAQRGPDDPTNRE